VKILFVAVIAVSALAQQSPQPRVKSFVHIVSANGKDDKVLYRTDQRFEAPNWSPDGKYLLLNSGGKLWKLALTGGEPSAVNTGSISRINNDHGITRDGKWFAISAGQVYIVPSEGGDPRQVTSATPSYFHGWSPDGKTLALCAQRNKNFDLYAIPFDGGPEQRLTESPGYDDGPDYSPDGKWIYFNSDRSGSWDIWRIPASGAGPNDEKAERVTSDDMEDWFPHPSPNGKQMVFVSFPKGTKGHPPNQNVVVRTLPMPGAKLKPGKPRQILSLFGGQGTMNVNSWSPDSKHFAYVSYEIIP
jgi:Tol biopolymer transport system component